ncbi:MAG: PEP-utilizing enzyme [Spirochaetaceae bacterium]
MKGIILAAGKGNIHLSSDKSIPKCLEDFDKNSTILDKALEAFNKNGIEDINIVGGFEIEKIMSNYPSLKYFYNEKWSKTQSLYSLYKAISLFNDDIIISYSDIVYSPAVIESLLSSSAEFVISYDSLWSKRYEGRTDEFLVEAEKLYSSGSGYKVSKVGDISSALGEFTGLIIIKKSIVSKFSEVIKSSLDKGLKSVIDFIGELSITCKTEIIDIKGGWAELDSSQDLYRFKFGTKAETLRTLENKLSKSTVLPQYSFVVQDYENNQDSVISEIKEKFSSNKLVIRSSALNEDTENSSMAGNYESILNIDINDKNDIHRGAKLVIDSYLKGDQEQNPLNQILVQPMLEDVTMCGVLFTKDLETSAPYYTINYDLSGSTESITAGSKGEHHTLIFYKFSNNLPADKNIQELILAVREIETFTGVNSLDIEFAFSNGKLYILQVRPIAAHKDDLKVFNNDITNELSAIRDYIKQDKNRSHKLVGNKTAYGVMPDWNPAEIIGINPKPLAFSLYKEIITDRIWPISRVDCGYRDTLNNPGILSFSGKPYVDIRMSFNSFTPKSLSDKTAHKLINYYIDKLNKHPEYHDKVEFLVAFTAYDLTIERRLLELKGHGFTGDEILEINSAFLSLTNSIILEETISIDEELDKTRSLKEVRENLKKSNIDLLSKVIILLDSTKEKGTLPFSNLARFGFMGVILLKSLRELKIISDSDYDTFFKSVHTVAKEFVTDIHSGDRKQLIKKYGHLRPGTYEVSSSAYHQDFDHYINLDNKPAKEENITFELTTDQLFKIDNILSDQGLTFDSTILFNFIRKATEGRELAKFEFSKNLSMALDYIKEYCESIGISSSDASYLMVEDIKLGAYGSISSNIVNEWIDKIEYRKSKHLITSAIKLPEIILSEKDLDYFFLAQSKPNFVTQKQITGKIIVLEGSESDIEGKIVCIENADPGFDWIFSHNIAGLITKYGGTNSHMAIRCAEFDLPAAIGCGDSIYDKVSRHSTIYLDCLGKKIEVIH